MKKSVARLICAAGALAVMACGAYALSSGDSLVTLSYLKDRFMPAALQQGEQAAKEPLDTTYENAKDTLDDLQAGYLGRPVEEVKTQYSETFQPRGWSDGDQVELPTGSGVLMLDGTVSVAHSGAVIDLTEGKEVASGARLLPNHRYLVGEGTTARFQILSGAAQMGVQGEYLPIKGTKKATPFYDVCQTDWYYAPVNYVYENHLFSGIDANHFGPFETMNRAMLMTVFYQMAGAPAAQMEAAGSVKFADVPDSAWYAPYVKWAYAQGITAGTGPDTFAPNQLVNRQQVVALLYSFATNYLGMSLDKRVDLSGYQDLSKADSWARDSLSWAVAQGVIGSTSSDTLILSPKQSANRAQVAAMLRAFGESLD